MHRWVKITFLCAVVDGLIAELVYCGIILEDELTLSSYGVKPGVTIHVLQKKQEPPEMKPRVLSEAEIQQLVVAFRAFTLSAGYRTALQVFSVK